MDDAPPVAAGSSTTHGSGESLGRRLLGMVRRRRSGNALQDQLIANLSEVAEAVSSSVDVDDALDAIVDRAKRITDTDKAVIVLFDEHHGTLDMETLTVRGRKDRHSQLWWQERLEAIGRSIQFVEEPLVETHPGEGAVLACAPIRVLDRPIGLLCAINSTESPFTKDQVGFLAILAAFAASAIENARLAEQSRYVLLASERDRIAREMHDGVVQSLFSISLGLELCKKQVMRDPAGVSVRLDDLQQHLNHSMTELRRFIYDLRPMKLAELGVTGAVEYWIEEITTGRPVRGRMTVTGELPRMSPSQEACLYRVAKESVSNIVRHAEANTFEVNFSTEGEMLILTITDDGVGFEADRLKDAGMTGLGLRSIKDRVRREGGVLRISSDVGAGTTLAVELPVRGAM